VCRPEVMDLLGPPIVEYCTKHLVSFASLVDDRTVVCPEAGDLSCPPKKFRGKMGYLIVDFHYVYDKNFQTASSKYAP